MISLPRVIIPLATAISVISAAQAPFNKDSPKKTVARADFDSGKLHGVLKFQAPNGTVRVHLDVTGLPTEGGPFQYHIHKLPVPASGNCDATETHFNPYDAPPDCSSQKDDSFCQVGDLSGKHGWINTTCFETRYWDPYLSLNPKNKAYPVGLSVNFHFANLTRFACANIQLSKERVDKKEGDVDDMEELMPLDAGLAFEEREYQEWRQSSTETETETHHPSSLLSVTPTASAHNYFNTSGNFSTNSSKNNWENVSENNGGKAQDIGDLGSAGAAIMAIVACFFM